MVAHHDIIIVPHGLSWAFTGVLTGVGMGFMGCHGF